MIYYFTAHTINCACHSRQSVFRVLGIYNFEKSMQFQCAINYNQLKPRMNYLICTLIFDFRNQNLFPTLGNSQVLSNLILFSNRHPEYSELHLQGVFRVQIKRVYDKSTYQNEILSCTVEFGNRKYLVLSQFFFLIREFYN